MIERPDRTDINWKIHYIEFRAWAEQNPKAAKLLGIIGLLFAGMILGVILF